MLFFETQLKTFLQMLLNKALMVEGKREEIYMGDGEISRRKFVSSLGLLSLSAFASPNVKADTERSSDEWEPAARDSIRYNPVVTPGIKTLPFTWDGDVKVFRLRPEPVTIQFQDRSDPHGMRRRDIHGYGYNGSIIGPTIEAVEGDKVRIIVENGLPEPTTVHWHGLHLPIEMDGVPGKGFSQKPIMPGETFVYEFPLKQHGTYFYHPHFMGAKQAGLGMSGFFIIHPRNPTPAQIVDRDYCYFLQIWMIHPGSSIPDTLEMNEFNYFTMNARPGPDVVPMTANIGEKIRIRVANLSMMSHPIHLHGHSFRISEYGAGFLPPNQQVIANTENISSAEVRSFEFQAAARGKWLFHCHFMHHVMNDMHRRPIPGGGGHAMHMNMEKGGMFTWIDIS